MKNASTITFALFFHLIARKHHHEREYNKKKEIIEENKFLWIVKNVYVQFTDYLWMCDTKAGNIM